MAFNLKSELAREAAPISTADFVAKQRISQPTLSRALRAAGSGVARWKSGRSTLMAATRHPGKVPVWALDAQGNAHALENLALLHFGGSVWRDWTGASHRFAGLPPDIEHVRPQGFLGRLMARRIAADMHVSTSPDQWDDDQVIRVLARYGDNLIGQLLVGTDSFERWIEQKSRTPIVAYDRLVEELPAMAEEVLSGEFDLGSSAGGEQPKFSAAVRQSDGTIRHVIVKFSPPMDTAVGLRWAELLTAECIAASTLRKHGVDAAASTVLDAKGRRFLIVERFDRVGAAGRRGVVSLAVLDDVYFGARTTTWVSASHRLENERMIDQQNAAILRRLHTFGQFIGNTDMHYGNVSLICDALTPGPMTIAPVYDMLPMAFAPLRTEVRPMAYIIPEITAGVHANDATLVAGWASQFWRACATMDTLSLDFREVAERKARDLDKRRNHPEISTNRGQREGNDPNHLGGTTPR